MDRQAQFQSKRSINFPSSRTIALENGEAGMTLDALAAELDLGKRDAI